MKQVLQLLATALLVTGLMYNPDAYGQKIPTSHNNLYFTESFEKDEGRWPVINDREASFTIRDNRYILKKYSKEGMEIIQPNFNSPLSSFRMLVSLTIENNKSEISEAGVIFKMQNDLSGYLFEINSRKDYRLRKLEGVKNYYLTGDSVNEGWIKSDLIKKTGEINQLEVRAETMVYDIYINGSFITSFADITWTHGNFGIILGPRSTAEVEEIKIFINENTTLKTEAIVNIQNETEVLKARNDSLVKINQQLQLEIIRLENQLKLERSKPIPEKSKN